MNTEIVHDQGTEQYCHMIRWCDQESVAEAELSRLLAEGWIGSLRDCTGIWQVDVVRPFQRL